MREQRRESANPQAAVRQTKAIRQRRELTAKRQTRCDNEILARLTGRRDGNGGRWLCGRKHGWDRGLLCWAANKDSPSNWREDARWMAVARDCAGGANSARMAHGLVRSHAARGRIHAGAASLDGADRARSRMASANGLHPAGPGPADGDRSAAGISGSQEAGR